MKVTDAGTSFIQVRLIDRGMSVSEKSQWRKVESVCLRVPPCRWRVRLMKIWGPEKGETKFTFETIRGPRDFGQISCG